jgi:DNA gyrase subunit A
MKRYGLTEIQATYILDTSLRKLTKNNKLELEAEGEQLRKEMATLLKILDDDNVLKEDCLR